MSLVVPPDWASGPRPGDPAPARPSIAARQRPRAETSASCAPRGSGDERTAWALRVLVARTANAAHAVSGAQVARRSRAERDGPGFRSYGRAADGAAAAAARVCVGPVGRVSGVAAAGAGCGGGRAADGAAAAAARVCVGLVGRVSGLAAGRGFVGVANVWARPADEVATAARAALSLTVGGEAAGSGFKIKLYSGDHNFVGGPARTG